VDIIPRATGGDPQQRYNALSGLLSRRVDGFILFDNGPAPEADIPSVIVGPKREGGHTVSVDLGSAASQLARLADGRAVELHQGENPFFPGIGALLPDDAPKKKGTVRLFDGLLPQEEGTSPDDTVVISATRRCPAVPPGAWKLYWPAFELGTLSARLLLNIIQGKGVRPQVVSVLPALTGPL